jgi:AraC family transcriptional regulator
MIQRASRGDAPRSFSVPGFDVAIGVHAGASELPRHFHERPTICCVQQGRFTEYYPGKSVDCDPRMVKITPAGEPHWNRFEGSGTLGVRIDVDRSRFRELPRVHGVLGERLFFREAAFEGMARQLIGELMRPDDASAVAAEGLLLQLVARLAGLAALPAAGTAPSWLRRADEVLHERFATSLTLADVATEAGVHPSTLARAYRSTYGCSVGERIRALRVEHAARQLALTRLPLSRVALDAGFYDQSHFTNTFRRRFRLTPAEYRRRYARRAVD